MRKTEVKDFFVQYLEKKYSNNPRTLTDEIIADHSRETAFWFTCKEVAFEVLQKKSKWYYLSFQIDDRKLIVEDEIVKNLPKWIKKQMAITEYMDTIESLLNWLFARYINTLKNSTNEKYNVHIKLDVVEYKDEKSFDDDMSTIDKIILDRFHNYTKAEKILILTKIWLDSWDDFDFDIVDLEYLCKKYNAPSAITFIEFEQKIQLKIVKDNYGNQQLLIDLED